jgi:hypothetical protein
MKARCDDLNRYGSLEGARAAIAAARTGAHRRDRHPQDDPAIVEVWL